MATYTITLNEKTKLGKAILNLLLASKIKIEKVKPAKIRITHTNIEWHDIIKAEYIKDYLIKVKFDDGKEVTANFYDFFHNNKIPFVNNYINLEDFKKFYINKEIPALSWGDNEVDIDPMSIYNGDFD
jgi:hypothetical protein